MSKFPSYKFRKVKGQSKAAKKKAADEALESAIESAESVYQAKKKIANDALKAAEKAFDDAKTEAERDVARVNYEKTRENWFKIVGEARDSYNSVVDAADKAHKKAVA